MNVYGQLLWKRVVLLMLVGVVLAKAEPGLAQITIVEHGPFDQMLTRYAEINRDDTRELAGYRVQILATTDRLALENAVRKFEELYPDYESDWVHEPPYYKLRTGAFTDKTRATAFLYRMKRDFPTAYPAMVRDIKPSELLLYH